MVKNTGNPNTKGSELTETTENYLKRIFWLTSSKGYARISEIAKLMGRSLSSTTEAVQRMASMGLVNYTKYGKITLTDEGKKIAEEVNTTYMVLSDLLVLLGVPSEIAIEDACSMEHQISATTLDRLKRFIRKAETDPKLKEALKEFTNGLK